MLPVLALTLAAIVVFVASARLVRHADAIADATGIGRLWVGSVLVAAATSLPELFTDVTAAARGVPDIGVGDLLGSTLANLAILAALDLVLAGGRLFHAATWSHALLGVTAIVLTSMAGVAIAAGGWGRLGHVGIDSIAIVLMYLLMMRRLHQHSRSSPPRRAGDRPGPSGAGRPVFGFALGAAGLFAVAPVLVLAAHAVALEAGVTETFVGTLLVGVATSLPELAASVAAVRLGAFDLAVGNVFGSSAFNMTILLAMDAVYPEPVLASVARDHLLTVLVAIACMALAVAPMLAKDARGPSSLRMESVLILTAYALAAWLLSPLGRG
jgi:cation:H+ antiporter